MIGTYVGLRDQALRVENALRQVLERQEVWHCNRVWEAWAVDTMSRDDFSLVTEDPVAIEELVQAVMSVSGAATVPDAATAELTEAIRLTVEYTGNDLLPAIVGWSWFDALKKYAPDVAQAFVDKPIRFPKIGEPDAATERAALAKAEIQHLKAALDGREASPQEWSLMERLEVATAALERVRALLQPTLGGTQTGEFAEVCGCGKDYFPCEHAAAILAALDGAPEPEEKP